MKTKDATNFVGLAFGIAFLVAILCIVPIDVFVIVSVCAFGILSLLFWYFEKQKDEIQPEKDR